MNPEHDHIETILDQLPLFPYRGETDSSALPEPPGRYSYRPRSYDQAILRYVAFYRLVTIHQAVYRFFIYDGKGPRYGFTVISHLIRKGLLQSEPLDPRLGAVSRQVISLTEDGWRSLGYPPPRKSQRAVSEHIREYRLQFAETMLEREADGWSLVRPTRSFAVLQKWGIRHYKDRLLNDTEAVLRERIERLPAFELPLRLLTNHLTGDIRLILPVRRGRSFANTINKLPSLALFPPIEFEIVCSHLKLLSRAQDYLKRWGDRTRSRVKIHRVDHFRLRPHPKDAPLLPHSRYEQSRSPNPRMLL